MRLIEIGIIAVCVIITATTICAVASDVLRWNKFSSEHKCVVVSHVNGQPIPVTTIGSKGEVSIGIASTPSQTTYKCDDGILYVR